MSAGSGSGPLNGCRSPLGEDPTRGAGRGPPHLGRSQRTHRRHSRRRRRTAGSSSVVGGLAGAAAAGPTPEQLRTHPPLLVEAALTAVVSTAAVLRGDRLPPRAHDPVVGAATAAITAPVLLGGGAVPSRALVMPHALDAFFFARPAAIAHLLVAVTRCVAVIPSEPGAALPAGVLTAGMVLAIGAGP